LTELRPIHLAKLAEKTRPVVILTRQAVIPYLTSITVAPITSRIRGLNSEVGLGKLNGLDHDSVANLDNIQTIAKSEIGRHLGFILAAQEPALSKAIASAFDLQL
jgi:mRNA interferase MazF